LLEEFGSPEKVFRAPLPRLEWCRLPAAVAQAVFKKQVFKLAEKELASNLQQCPREFRIVVNEPSISIVGTRNGRAIGVLGTGGNVCYAKEKQEVVREGAGKGSNHQRVPTGNTSRAGELAYPELDCGRGCRWAWWW
jgi:hypothetical protein